MEVFCFVRNGEHEGRLVPWMRASFFGAGNMTREELINRILETYEPYYDITLCEGDGYLKATADFHEEQHGFILVRRAEMWSAGRHEYCFIYSAPRFTTDVFKECVEKTRNLGEEKVDPAPGHMSSSIVAVFICDEADPEAVKALKKYRFTKNFKFSFNGWMEVHTALAALSDDIFEANAAGRANADFLKSLVHPKQRKKKGSIFKILGGMLG